jgi:hypothetical protein
MQSAVKLFVGHRNVGCQNLLHAALKHVNERKTLKWVIAPRAGTDKVIMYSKNSGN